MMEMDHGMQHKPVPKPRTSLLNNKSRESSSETEPAEFFFEEKPPLPPRTSSVKLPTPVFDDRINGAVSTDELNSEPDDVHNNEFRSSYQETLEVVLPSAAEGLSVKRSVYSGSSSSLTTSTMKSDGEAICFSGWVRMLHPKKLKRCWAIIRNNILHFTQSDEVESIASFSIATYDLTRCIYVGKVAVESDEIILFTVNPDGTDKDKNSSHLNSVRFVSEELEKSEYWLLFLTKCYYPKSEKLQNNLTELDVGGHLWVKQGVNGVWNSVWAYICDRKFYYWLQGSDELNGIDIRKILFLRQRDIPISNWCNFIENSSNGPILIAMDGISLYFQNSFDQCTETWYDFLLSELTKIGTTLEENRLTNDEVPVIVDKCIKFISTYGLKQPGIYRKPGPISESKSLIESFNQDPHTVHLIPINDESVNAVADVLRSFFRHLSSPLVPIEFHDRLTQNVNCENESLKIQEYHNIVVCSLPVIHHRTLKKLLGHLKEVIEHADKNKASLENLSMIFGPTLFGVNQRKEQFSANTYAQIAMHVQVIKDLLTYFYEIFEVQVEKNKTSKFEEAQEHNVKVTAKGFLVPIHLFTKDNKCFNVQSGWTASQVVSFKIEKDNIPSIFPFEDYALFEVAKNGQMERRVSGDETLTSIALGRWLDWEANSDFYLLFKKDPYPFHPQNARPFAEDIKMAEPGSKTFRSAQLKIKGGTKVVQYSKKMKRVCEWTVDEMLWFVGGESDRNAPYPYSLTFFLTNLSCKTKFTKIKFPGYCVSFKDEIQRYQWLNSIIICKQEFLPAPLITI